MEIETTTMQTPIGPLRLAFRDGALCALRFAEHEERFHQVLTKRFGAVSQKPAAPNATTRAVDRYFGGDLNAMSTIAVDPEGSPFQRRVWTALLSIPPGRTATYGEVAEMIGAPTAVRAVARANATNPIGIVIPCHRVIGAGGDLRGYGGGLERKRWLLEHEGATFKR